MEQSGAYLELRNISKSFRDGRGNRVEAVHDLSLQVQRGEFVTIIGPSGCGKTTTLRMVSGIEDPDSGEILLEGKRLTGVPPQERNMPMVFQSYALFPHMTIFDNIAYGLKLRNMSRDQIATDVAEACRMVNLSGVQKRYPGELSGGQQQRVALARALVLKPEIILFDEPLSNLDAKLRIQTRTEIKRVQQAMGVTALYVTHDQSEALSLSDNIVIMDHGKIAQSGSPETVYNSPASPFVSDFIGNANFFDGEVSKAGAQTLEVHAAGHTFSVPIERCDSGLEAGSAVRLAVKPELVSISREKSPFAVTVDVASFVGPITEYKLQFEVDSSDSPRIITAIESNVEGFTTVYHAGEQVYMHLKDDQIRAYRA